LCRAPTDHTATPKHQAQLSPLYCGADAAEKYGTVRFVNQILLSRDSLKGIIKAVKVVENLLSDVGVRLRVTRSEIKDVIVSNILLFLSW
jgi:uncharacterized membrane protein (UPF0136 family)